MYFRAPLTLLAGIATLISSSMAAPVADSELQRRDDWEPAIIYPRENIVWKSGYRHSVVWDTSSQPEQITNPIGKIQLRKDGVTQPAILAEGFQLTDGRVEITVPDVEPGCGYQLVLFGNSGNFSPQFIIAAEGD